MGSNRLCSLCDLEYETTEHLFKDSIKVYAIWMVMSNHFNMQLNFHGSFSSGNWIVDSYIENSIHCKSIIAANAWHIWKARCNYIFRDGIFLLHHQYQANNVSYQGVLQLC